MTSDALRRVLDATGPLLLDFDGPICSIFSRFPANALAGRLRDILTAHGVDVPGDLAGEHDPLEVLRWTGRLGRDELTRMVEDTLSAAELEAARLAAPTLYAREVIVAGAQAGRPIAIVSNNSPAAVRAYLDAHRLSVHIGPVIGRAYGQPHRMKPSPEPILTAVSALGAAPRSCALVGDSASDIEAARAAGVRSIAYVNKPGKAERLRATEPDATIESMAELAIALLETDADLIADVQR
jgi:HAD superfamily hydrolase (TIGR01509 family)